MATTPTLRPAWLDLLNQTLRRLKRQPDHSPRVAIVGIGHELRGDDAAGVAVARALQRNCTVNGVASNRDNLFVINAGAVPENCTGPLRRFGPDLVLLVDAAQMDEAPGAVRWLPWQETGGLSASTHTLPPYVLASYLTGELGCEVALIGIQPTDVSFGEQLTPPVEQAVAVVVQGLAEAL